MIDYIAIILCSYLTFIDKNNGSAACRQSGLLARLAFAAAILKKLCVAKKMLSSSGSVYFVIAGSARYKVIRESE